MDNFIRWVIHYGKIKGYPHAVTLCRDKNELNAVSAWLSTNTTPDTAFPWTQNGPEPSVVMFKDPRQAFDFKMRFG